MNEELIVSGREKIDWVASYMPVLSGMAEEFKRELPFRGMRIAMSIHMEAKTAYLSTVLAMGGAEVYATGCNPLSTQDDVAAALAERGVSVFARHGATEEEYKEDLLSVLRCHPHLLIDDGGDLTFLLHGEARAYADCLIGGGEETTTGVRRLIARAEAGDLDFPMFDVNDADCKHLFDNRYGTGQSVLDGLMHPTNLMIAGKCAVVAGYGWCGKGCAMRLKGMGASVIVTEVDEVKALEAVMDGFAVMPMEQAASEGDLFVTLTGCRDVIRAEHFERMKDGVLLSNAGHFDVEIDKRALAAMATEILHRKPDIVGYRMKDGRILNLMAEGRLVNLAAGNGHPAEIMDMSFSLQAACLRYLATHEKPAPGVYPVPEELDREVAKRKLAAMGRKIDTLTKEQRDYLNAFE